MLVESECRGRAPEIVQGAPYRCPGGSNVFASTKGRLKELEALKLAKDVGVSPAVLKAGWCMR